MGAHQYHRPLAADFLCTAAVTTSYWLHRIYGGQTFLAQHAIAMVRAAHGPTSAEGRPQGQLRPLARLFSNMARVYPSARRVRPGHAYSVWRCPFLLCNASTENR